MRATQIDFGTERSANSDQINDLRDQPIAEQAEMAELFENYAKTLELTQTLVESIQRI